MRIVLLVTLLAMTALSQVRSQDRECPAYKSGSDVAQSKYLPEFESVRPAKKRHVVKKRRIHKKHV